MQPKRARLQSHLQRIKNLERFIQMKNGEVMGSNRQTEAKTWQFGYLGVRLTHKTVQKNKNAAKTSHPKAVYNT
jgi:hypothetical protein